MWNGNLLMLLQCTCDFQNLHDLHGTATQISHGAYDGHRSQLYRLLNPAHMTNTVRLLCIVAALLNLNLEV